jgi:hypothetical protein
MKFLTSLTLLFFLTIGYTQSVDRNASINTGLKLKKMNAQRLLKTKLIILVDTNNKQLNTILRESFSKYWKHNVYEFKSVSEEKKFLNNNDFTVFCILKNIEKNIKSNQEKVLFYSLALILGNSSSDEIIKKEKIIELNLPHTYDEKNGAQLEEFNFLIPFYIKKLNQEISNYLVEKETAMKNVSNSRFYNNGEKKIKNKEILVYNNAANKNFNIEHFATNLSIDKKRVKLVDQKEIENSINADNENNAIVYFFEKNTSECSVFDVKTTELLAFTTSFNMNRNKLFRYAILPAIGVGIIVYKLQGNKSQQLTE